MEELTTGTGSYLKDAGAQSYLNFINSKDGKIFQQAQGDAIVSRLNGNTDLKMLDAGCGPGWLAKRLQDMGHQVEACDAAPTLIDYAKKHFPSLPFQIADLTKELPYGDAAFDAVIFSMAALDMPDQNAAFKNLHRVLKPGGKLIVTIVNPYYGFPVGVWKRGLSGFLLRQKPKLKLRSYQHYARQKDRSFRWSDGRLVSYFYTLPEQVNAFLKAGFELAHLEDIAIDKDSDEYDLAYRLYRFPVFVLMEFKKP